MRRLPIARVCMIRTSCSHHGQAPGTRVKFAIVHGMRLIASIPASTHDIVDGRAARLQQMMSAIAAA